MSSGSIDIARLVGIRTVAAAVIFAVLYFPLLLLFVWKSIRSPQYVHIIVALFCAVRVVSFSMRAAMAASTATGSNEQLFEAEFILYNVGFFGVLYSAYTLVLDRELLSDIDRLSARLPGPARLLLSITRNRQLVRIALLVAVVLGIVGATQISGTSIAALSQGQALRSVGTYIFLAVSALLVLQALLLFYAEVVQSKSHASSDVWTAQPSPGAHYGAPLLLLIGVLLLVREAFFGATARDFVRQNEEALFYPLAALPELLAVGLLAVPGLMPPREALRREEVGLVGRVFGQERA